jgi:molybdenum cofactor biosynthesis enzyme MoaA
MAPDLPKKIKHKIEQLCEQGCTQINQLLDKAENNNEIEELSEFSKSEIRQIINELEEIMSVYNDKKSPSEK